MKTDSGQLLLTFGTSLKELRKARGLSQEDLALKCDLDRTYISGLERGRRNPTLKVLAIVADQLEISLSELLSSLDNRK